MNNNLISLSNERFRLLKEAKRLFIYLDTYIFENFPKNKKHLKILCFDELNRLLDNLILANNTDNSVKKKYQYNALLNISKIDFLLSYIFDLNILTKRRYTSALRILSNIKLILSSWINEEKK